MIDYRGEHYIHQHLRIAHISSEKSKVSFSFFLSMHTLECASSEWTRNWKCSRYCQSDAAVVIDGGFILLVQGVQLEAYAMTEAMNNEKFQQQKKVTFHDQSYVCVYIAKKIKLSTY